MKKKNEVTDDFHDFLLHLEYLGYEIQLTGGDEDHNGVSATHHQRANLWVFKRFMGIGISMTYGMGQNAVTHQSEYLKIINEFNSKSIVSVFFTNIDAERPNIHLCAMYTSPYDKRSFSIFMDEVHKDHDEMRKVSGFDFFAEDEPAEVVADVETT